MNAKKVVFSLGFLLLTDLTFMSCSPKGAFPSSPLTLRTPPTQTDPISPYDDIMRRVAAEEDMDWRWLAAIAYQESRFIADIQSSAGAKGLMQIMGSVAREFGVPAEQVIEPATNIRLAVKLIKRIEQSLHFTSKTSERDRKSIVLACYNAGLGHIFDARRLAVKLGANHNSWSSLSEYVTLKGTPEWCNDEVVRNGAFNGGETIDFVAKVMRQYTRYCEKYT